MAHTFKHQQVLTSNGIETEEIFTSPVYSTIEDAHREGVNYWNEKKKIDWQTIDKENAELYIDSKLILKGENSVFR